MRCSFQSRRETALSPHADIHETFDLEIETKLSISDIRKEIQVAAERT